MVQLLMVGDVLTGSDPDIYKCKPVFQGMC